ncbi:hypothetical protein IG631_05055 [Alternaria alternata]|nr:hypothetical protein IG631_05055 [Alternaria alternata]
MASHQPVWQLRSSIVNSGYPTRLGWDESIEAESSSKVRVRVEEAVRTSLLDTLLSAPPSEWCMAAHIGAEKFRHDF